MGKKEISDSKFCFLSIMKKLIARIHVGKKQKRLRAVFVRNFLLLNAPGRNASPLFMMVKSHLDVIFAIPVVPRSPN